MGEDDDGQRELFRTRERIARHGAVVRAPRLVERRPKDRQQEREDPWRGDRAKSERRPAQW